MFVNKDSKLFSEWLDKVEIKDIDSNTYDMYGDEIFFKFIEILKLCNKINEDHFNLGDYTIRTIWPYELTFNGFHICDLIVKQPQELMILISDYFDENPYFFHKVPRSDDVNSDSDDMNSDSDDVNRDSI